MAGAPPDLVVVGHITLDVTASGRAPAAPPTTPPSPLTGWGCASVSSAPFGDDFPADALPADGIALARVPASQTTMFRLAETGQGRDAHAHRARR